LAISFISNALGGTTTTTSFSIALPTTQANDVLILEFCHRGTGNGTIGGTSVTTGGLTWTLKHSQLFATSAFSGKTYWTRATGNHATQTVTGSSLTNSCAAIVTVYRGCVSTGDPLADATIVGEQNASGNETQAQITTATDGAEVCLVVVNSPDLGVSSGACTSPGTLLERAERLSTGGTDSSVSHWSNAKATAGGTGAFTWAQTNAASGSWAYALVPVGTQTFQQTVAAIAVGQASLSRASTFKRTLAMVAVGTAALSTVKVFKQTVAAIASGLAGLSTKLVFKTTVAAIGTGTAGMTRSLTFRQTVGAVAIGAVTLATDFTQYVGGVVAQVVMSRFRSINMRRHGKSYPVP